MYGFVEIFYKNTTILELAKSEVLSTMLTPSDEAFILLLIIVYFKDNADTEYTECCVGISFVLRSGWQEAAIHLWNTLYQRIEKDWIEYGECFDMEFWY